MNFFFDRNVPERCARMIAAYESSHAVVFHDDEFEKTIPDTEWVSRLGRRDGKWAVVSGDGSILKNKAEIAVLRSTNLHFFVLARNWWKGDFHDRAVQLLKVWRSIRERALNERHPKIWGVPISSIALIDHGRTMDLRSG